MLLKIFINKFYLEKGLSAFFRIPKNVGNTTFEKTENVGKHFKSNILCHIIRGHWTPLFGLISFQRDVTCRR